MGSFYYFRKLIALTSGRLCRQLGLLAGLAVLCVVLPVLAGTAADAALSDGVDFSGVVLAVTGAEGDDLPGQLERYMNGMEDVAQYCRIEAMSRDAARDALADGRVTAVLDLPEGFLRGVQAGDNPPVKVVVDGSRPLESLLTLWVGQSAADLLAAAQAGIYAVLDCYDAVMPEISRERVVTEINLKYALWTLNREEMFVQKRLLPTDTLPVALHYRLSLLACLALSAPPVFAWIFQPAWVTGLRRMRYAGRNALWAFGAGVLAVWLVMVPMLTAAVGLVLGGSLPDAILTAVVWGTFFAAFAAVCALLTRSAAGCGGLSFFLALGALALAGGIVPPVLMPDAVRRLGGLSPVSWMREAAAGALGYGGAVRAAAYLMLTAGVLCWIAGVLYVRRADRKEDAL